MSMLLNSFRFVLAVAGIQYVGGRVIDLSAGLVNGSPYDLSLAGTLTGGISSTPADGDLVVIEYQYSGSSDRSNLVMIYDPSAPHPGGANITMTQDGTAYANDTYDASITVAHIILPSSHYDLYRLASATGTLRAIIANIRVFRGVDAVTPMDVAAVTTSGINTGLPDPGSITPVTSGAKIVVFGAGAFGPSISSAFTSSDFDLFESYPSSQTSVSGSTGFGLKAWTSGAFNAAAFGGGSALTSDSWAAVALALRPA